MHIWNKNEWALNDCFESHTSSSGYLGDGINTIEKILGDGEGNLFNL